MLRGWFASEYAAWHGKYFEDCGDETACIRDGARCVSEGIGYAMLAAVSAGDQPTFDNPRAFYVKHKNPRGVMKWQIAVCGEAMNQDGAPDAALDAACALLQAHSRARAEWMIHRTARGRSASFLSKRWVEFFTSPDCAARRSPDFVVVRERTGEPESQRNSFGFTV